LLGAVGVAGVAAGVAPALALLPGGEGGIDEFLAQRLLDRSGLEVGRVDKPLPAVVGEGPAPADKLLGGVVHHQRVVGNAANVVVVPVGGLVGVIGAGVDGELAAVVEGKA